MKPQKTKEGLSWSSRCSLIGSLLMAVASGACGAGEQSSQDSDACVPGTRDCSCTDGGSCDPSLACVAMTCVDAPMATDSDTATDASDSDATDTDSCLVGTEGCSCTNGGVCDPGLVCQSLICVRDPACGDGVLDGGEECDEGGSNNDNAECTSLCTIARCGDALVQSGVEECDDGFATATCDTDCTLATCGDGTVNLVAGEVCDDRGESPTCDDDCTGVLCGDGRVNVTAGENCDDAGESAICDVDCTDVECGDATLNASAGEQCDDGNANANDSCDLSCQLSLGESIVGLTAGQRHNCIVTDSGSVRCWGDGGWGVLGYGNTNDIGDNETAGAAGPVILGGEVVQIDAGNNHTCAVLQGGDVRCWGQANYGELGYGNDEEHIGDDEVPASVEPVDIGGSALAVSAGSRHTCALLAGGDVRCWGHGNKGQLGYGNTETIGDGESPSSVEPVQLGGPALQVSAGWGFSCALLEGGGVRCWGDGRYGVLGQGNTGGQTCLDNNMSFSCSKDSVCCIGDDEVPAEVPPIELGGPAVEISAGLGHVCVLMQGGEVRCWGSSTSGEIGHGNTETIGDDEFPGSISPVDVGGPAVQVSAGSGHTCVLLESGEIRCWGYGSFGVLGHGTSGSDTCQTNDSFSCDADSVCCIGDDEPPVAGPPLALGGEVNQIRVGDSHSCVLLTGGDVRCWGWGDDGRLGYGNTGGNACLDGNNYRCHVDPVCCLGDEPGDMPPPSLPL